MFVFNVQLNFPGALTGPFDCDVALDPFRAWPRIGLLPRPFRIFPSQELSRLGMETVQ